MGKIEFVGIINDFLNTEIETEESIVIPENAHFIEDENWVDMSNPLNWNIVSMPIFLIILIIMFLKQRKNGIFNKVIKNEYVEKNKITDKRKMVLTTLKRFLLIMFIFIFATILIAPFHELLHCITGSLVGLDMKFGIDPQSFIAFAYTEDSLTKMHFLVMSLTPLVILGIIPLIVLFIKYPKEKMDYKKGLKYWILTCFIGAMIMSCSPDIIQSYNYIKRIPSNAIVKEDYWYIPNEITDLDSTINSVNEENKKVYSIKDKKIYLYEDTNDIYEDYRGIKLLEYDNSNNNYAEIYYILYDYTTDPSFCYTLEITDELNNSLLVENKKEQQIVGGIVSTVRIRKLSLDNKINFSVFEKDAETNNIVNSSQTQINLNKDLEEKIKINQSSNLNDGKLGEVNFKYIDSENVYFGTTSHYYSEKLVGEDCSLPIKVQYGNYLVSEEHIEFSCYKNVNNLSLEKAFESLVLINENFGQYGLSDVYGMDITDEKGELIDTVIITFEEMIKLCNGLTIEKDGKKYTKESFEGFAEMPMVKDKEVEIGTGINAIKYYFRLDGDNERDNYQYMFIYNDNIYNIRVPINKRIDNEIQQFLDSVELV